MLKLTGIVQISLATRLSWYIRQMNLMNSHSGSAMMTAPETFSLTIATEKDTNYKTEK